MNKLKSEQYLKMVQELQKDEFNITAAKNNDYSGVDLAFNNFDLVEKLGICSAEVGILVRMTDKLSRITNLISGTDIQVKDEKITDTLCDLVNYARILNIYIRTKEYETDGEGVSEKAR